MNPTDPYGDNLVAIGPWRPLPAGDCRCNCIGDHVSRRYADCPHHGAIPVIQLREWRLLDAIDVDEPEQALPAIPDYSLAKWKPRDVIRVYVQGLGYRWTVGLERGRTGDFEGTVEFAYATRTGGWYHFTAPARVRPDRFDNTLSVVSNKYHTTNREAPYVTVDIIIRDVTTNEGDTWATLHMADCPKLQSGEPGVNEHALSAHDVESAEAIFRKQFAVSFETRRHTCINRHLNEIDKMVTVTQLADQMRVPRHWLQDQADGMECEQPEGFYTIHPGPNGEDKLSLAAELLLRRAIERRRSR